MLLTITTTHQPASDLGYLLHKHPDIHQEFQLSFGKAHVFYPENNHIRCTAALLLDIDPLNLVKSFRGRGGPRMLEHYINDRPYVASSFMSVAISRVLGSALHGRSKDRPELCNTAIPLEINITSVPVRGGETFLENIFLPLGYELLTKQHLLDDMHPEWGLSHYYTITLKGNARLQEVLSHLYVLIPVLDKEKHYYVSEDEVQKLLKHGEGWLKEHPRREVIVNRYLKFQRRLTRIADTSFSSVEDEVSNRVDNDTEEQLEKPIYLNQKRYKTVINLLKEKGVNRIVDLGCGEGKFLRELLKVEQFSEIVGIDVSSQALHYAEKKLKLDDLADNIRARIKLLHGSLIYRDSRISGYDAACCLEVIEHMELDRLDAFEKALFYFAKPNLVIITTPNKEYNTNFSNLADGKYRHSDHRFEWSRLEFQNWLEMVCKKYQFTYEIFGIGDIDEKHGAPTQGALFYRTAAGVPRCIPSGL